MFQIEWAQKDVWQVQKNIVAPTVPSRLDKKHVQKVLFLVWEEHCVECAVPECYSICPLYVARADKACSRFVYGIYPNKNFKGQFDFGADIRFRRWGKLEAAFNTTSVPVKVMDHSVLETYRRLPDRLRFGMANVVDKLSSGREDFDEFVMECFSPQEKPFRLMLEYFTEESRVRTTRFRHSFEIQPGQNYFTLPYEKFNRQPGKSYLYLYPEEEGADEKRLVFTWLDFVQYKEEHKPKPQPKTAAPAARVKCVAWDLDNTLWKGILAETHDTDTLAPYNHVVEMIKKLDERGIIQTVISKNNHEDAWQVITRCGLQDYFIYPAINWGQKSENLKAVAEKINIGLDTFAFIDDSPFERKEVQQALPQIRVYTDQQVNELLNYEEFDVPVTSASKTRRLSYLAEMKRDLIQASFTGSYEDFLISCGMRMHIFTPQEEDHIVRCWELIQRTNQLNLSNRRYQIDEFRQFLSKDGIIGAAFQCSDNFGDYGIVGFASIDNSGENPVLLDFVLSCRVAQKRVEHTFIRWLSETMAAQDKACLQVNLIRTAKNKPLLQVFNDLPFEIVSEDQQQVAMQLPSGRTIGFREVISLSVDV